MGPLISGCHLVRLMGRLIRVVMVCVVVAALVLVAVVLGFVAEHANSKSFVGYDGTYCVYRRTAALNCGVAAALFLLAGLVVLGAASGCFGHCGEASAHHISSRRRRRNVARMDIFFWTLTAMVMSAFLYGAWWNAGARNRPTGGHYYSTSDCPSRDHDVFTWAAVVSPIAFAFGIAAYVYRETADREQLQSTGPSLAMGQQPPVFQPHQEYQQQAYPAMGYPVADPPPPYGSYGAKAPATACTA